MTTLVVLATKDTIVLGCDSLGTFPKYFVDPLDLLPFFNKNGTLRTDDDGKPIIKKFGDIGQFAKEIPFDHMTHVDKLFSLDPLPMGVMATGISSIGKNTIKGIINEFSGELPDKNIPVSDVAKKLLKFVEPKYEEKFKDAFRKPYLEFMLCGYDTQGGNSEPHIIRIIFPDSEVAEVFADKNKFGVAFGGQMKEIQRIVHGTDLGNKVKIINRHQDLMEIYRQKLQEELKKQKCDIELPGKDVKKPEAWGWKMFSGGWQLNGFDANWGDFSDQNAIECVNFFVKIMINSQQFSDTMPTVGGGSTYSHHN